MPAVSTAYWTAPTSSGLVPAGNIESSRADQTAVVILSSVLSVATVVAAAGLVVVCCRLRQRRGGVFFPRGSSPIGDDEIETWKGKQGHPKMSESEKQPSRVADVCVNVNGKPDSPPLLPVAALGAGATVQRQAPLPPVQTFDRRAVSLGDFQQDANPRGSVVLPFSSLPKKGPSNVIIYKDTPQTTFTPKFASPSGQFSPLLGMAVTIDRASAAPPAVCAHHHSFENQQTVPLYRRSEEYTRRSTRSASFGYPAHYGMAGRFSLDQDREVLFPFTPASMQSSQTALQYARAPNSRAGLTDETVPGDPSFLPAPKRLPSRLFKMPPATGSPSVTAAATAATVNGDDSACSVSRWISFGSRGSKHFPLPPGDTNSCVSTNFSKRPNFSAATRRARSRSTRSCSTIRCVGPEMAGDCPAGQSPRDRSPSVPRNRSMARPLQLQPQPQQQSPVTVFGHHMPASPLPVSIRPDHCNEADGNIYRNSCGIYQKHIDQGKRPRQRSSSSTLASSSSSFSSDMGARLAEVRASDDSNAPLLGGLSPPRVSECAGSHKCLESIGLAIG